LLAAKAAFARGGAGVEGVSVREAPVPEPGAGEALVRLHAASLNYRDLLAVRGLLPGTKSPEFVPLSDAVGQVVAVGPDVTRVAAGDRVSPLFAQGWVTGPRPTPAMLGGPIDGVARQYAVFEAESLCLVPDEIGDLEAATLPCAGLTAWNALFGARPVQPGEWVLVQGTGGVAIAALQWARAAGAHVIVTSSSDAKLARATALRADIAINYRTSGDWAEAALAARNGAGVDIVVDVVGEAQIEQCARVVAPGGVISAVGRLEGSASWGKEVGKPVIPIVVGNREQHEAMLIFCARHGIRPVVDAVYDLDRLPQAMQRLERGDFLGKIAINLR
jgi:NADPH:quinone reductase-like Zn-dependent oxidoreductase